MSVWDWADHICITVTALANLVSLWWLHGKAGRGGRDQQG